MNFISRIINSILPPRCVICGKVVEQGNKCCSYCSAILKPLPNGSEHISTMGVASVVPYIYDSKSSHIIVELKRTGDGEIAKYLGEAISLEIKKLYPDIIFDVVTTVPMSKKKFKEYGFNHAELLSEVVAEKLDVTHMPNLLGRKDDSKPQHELGSRDRNLNAENSYFINENIDLRDKNILLIDDIVTTGATLKTCSELIMSMGASKVYCATAMGK